MAYSTIVMEIRDHVGLIRLNRPESRNALNSELMSELADALKRLEANEAVGAIVLTGSDGFFAAGADVVEMRDLTFVDAFRNNFITDGWEATAQARKPIIAAVAGYALGGGCELALMCDMIFAADDAKFGQPEINLGIMPGIGGSQRLARFIGKSKTMDLCLTGRMMDAAEAERCGLASRIFPAADLLEETIKVASKIAEKSMIATAAVKESVNSAYETSLAEGLRFERRLFHALFATDDQTEGMTAFIEKRQPQFRNK